jgi:hypothetical protein
VLDFSPPPPRTSELRVKIPMKASLVSVYDWLQARPEFDFRQGRDFSLLHNIQAGFGAQLSYSVCTWGKPDDVWSWLTSF